MAPRGKRFAEVDPDELDGAAEFIEHRGAAATAPPVDLDAPAPRLIDPATIPIRFSRLRRMAASALHYLDACQANDTDTLSRRLGSGTHAMLLGNPVVKWTERTKAGDKIAPRSSKSAAYVAFRAKHPGAVILSPTEWRAAERMVNAVKSHRLARELLEGAKLEHEINWFHEQGANDIRPGRACSSHLDIYRPGELVADFKTAREIQPRRFSRVAVWSYYHAQIAFYRQAARRGRGDLANLAGWIIGVESAAPHAVVCYRLKPELILDGEQLCDRWVRDVLACEDDRAWPGISDAAVELGRLDDDEDAPATFNIDDEEIAA